MDRRILALLVIIALLSIGIVYSLYNTPHEVKSNDTVKIENRTLNATLNESVQTESESYGQCAICGKSLSYSEANDEYTQGKVCHDCAANPYYQTDEGAQYANQKLIEAYPDEYSWMDESHSSDYDTYDDYDDNSTI